MGFGGLCRQLEFEPVKLLPRESSLQSRNRENPLLDPMFSASAVLRIVVPLRARAFVFDFLILVFVQEILRGIHSGLYCPDQVRPNLFFFLFADISLDSANLPDELGSESMTVG